MVSKKASVSIASILLDFLPRQKAIHLIGRLQQEVRGNKSYRDTLKAILKCYKPKKAERY